MKPMNRREFISTLIKEGWTEARNNGKHNIYTHELSSSNIIVPHEHGSDVSVGVIRKTTPIRNAVNNTNKGL